MATVKYNVSIDGVNSRSSEDFDAVVDAPEIFGRVSVHLTCISPYERKKVKD